MYKRVARIRYFVRFVAVFMDNALKYKTFSILKMIGRKKDSVGNEVLMYVHIGMLMK